MEPKISVLIPVYKEPKHLILILNRLVRDSYKDKEIFVIFDGPCKNKEKIISSFKKVNFVINKKNEGKVYSLNKGVKLSTGEILVFLDNDIEIPEGRSFLKGITEEIRGTDILDIKKKVVRDSFLAKMTFYEYVGFNIGSWLVSKYIGKSPALNGSAFAMRRTMFESLGGFRKVIAEDLDIATRAFLEGYRFKYAKGVGVYNYVYSKWTNWIKQRRRWALGTAFWLKRYYRELIRSFLRSPQIFIPGLFFLFPALAIVILDMFLPDILVHKLLSVAFLFLAVKFSPILPILVLGVSSIGILKGLVVSLLSFLAFSALFFSFSRKIGFEFKIHEFFIYYFFYSLLWLLIMIIGLIQVFLFHNKPQLTWKV